MKPEICPFCGVVTDVRHEAQQACIEALQSEIAMTRRLLEQTAEITALPSHRDEGQRPD